MSPGLKLKPVTCRTVAAWSNWAVLPCALHEVLAGDVGDLRVGHVAEVLARQVLGRDETHEMQVVRGAGDDMGGVTSSMIR